MIDNSTGIQFCLITDEGAIEHNLALADETFVDVGRPDNKPDPLPASLWLALRQRVFRKGEILIVDASGREIPYPGRKPDKWGVTYEVFDTVEQALNAKLALEGV